MKIVLSTAFLLASGTSIAFAYVTPAIPGVSSCTTRSPTTFLKMGYLDDLTKYTGTPEKDERDPDIEKDDRDYNKAKETDRYGVSDWQGFVDFDEFDGGDGQMGVAGDGKKGLEKEWEGAAQMAKSKVMSAKNAWGKTTGYADALIEQGVESQRAQQLENWHNQQEVIKMRQQQRYMTEDFDTVSTEEDWRSLSKFGVERNQDFDLDSEFGAVTPGDVVGVIELNTRINRNEVYEFPLRNSFMGFSDFRARFTADTTPGWTVEPTEGSLNGRKDTDFVVKFRPSNPGVQGGYLVIETEEDKWTYQLIGNASM